MLALDDAALTAVFEQFNREKDGAGLSVDEQLARLLVLGCKMRSSIAQLYILYCVLMEMAMQSRINVQGSRATWRANCAKENPAREYHGAAASCPGSQAKRHSGPLGCRPSTSTFGEQRHFDNSVRFLAPCRNLTHGVLVMNLGRHCMTTSTTSLTAVSQGESGTQFLAFL